MKVNVDKQAKSLVITRQLNEMKKRVKSQMLIQLAKSKHLELVG